MKLYKIFQIVAGIQNITVFFYNLKFQNLINQTKLTRQKNYIDFNAVSRLNNSQRWLYSITFYVVCFYLLNNSKEM